MSLSLGSFGGDLSSLRGGRSELSPGAEPPSAWVWEKESTASTVKSEANCESVDRILPAGAFSMITSNPEC